MTGAGRGIGRATALELAARGAHVAVNDVANPDSAEEVARLVRERGVQSVVLMGDVSRAADVQRVIDTAVEVFGRLEILVNNAGVESIVPLLELTEAEWERVTRTNLKGEWLCAQATGISTTLNPDFLARKSNSGSNPQRSIFCWEKICAAAGRVKALKPHCVSLKFRPKTIRSARLKRRPKSWRYQGCRSVCNSLFSQREPMATSAPPRMARSSLGASSMGEDRSASLNSSTSPLAFSIPLRTL